ncbi:MAG: hypothetical protein GY938_27105 [Ketobacter sp.]|nr:hypothetical protein [Ketobacter sp.]
MATLTVQTALITGVAVTYNSAAAGGDDFPSTGQEIIIIRNASGAERTITITTTQVIETDLDVEDRVVAVADGTDEMIGAFSIGLYSNSVAIAYDSETNVSVAVLKTR